jgi:GNAT superfamily N-acetyltransferase
MQVMDVTSLGFRTHLMICRLAGSEICDRDHYLVVRSPQNPTFWWGNFILVAPSHGGGEPQEWLKTFASEFPAAEHVAIGVDGTDGDTTRLAAPARAASLELEVSAVLTATSVNEPPRPNREAEFRPLRSEDDWQQAVELRAAVDREQDSSEHRVFLERRQAAMRHLADEGRGAWFGAFLGGRMRSGLGIFSDGGGVARYQTVDTHPDFERRGLAGTLVYEAGRYGLEQLGARTLVIAADPDYVAIRVYRSVGFTEVEGQVELSRPPRPTA